jgi:hypothetical protein
MAPALVLYQSAVIIDILQKYLWKKEIGGLKLEMHHILGFINFINLYFVFKYYMFKRLLKSEAAFSAASKK